MINFFKLSFFTKLGYLSSGARQSPYPNERDLSHKTFIITGANSGLGYETTKVLLQMKANVIIICRNQEKLKAALKDFKSLHLGTVTGYCYDLSDLSSVQALAQKIKDQNITLIHNAGALVHKKVLSAQNLEATFASMTLIPFALTLELISQLEKVIWVSSGGMYGVAQNISDYNFEKRKFDGVKAYAESKRNQVDLAKLFSDKYPQLKAYSMHPGWVDTPGVQKSLPTFRKLTKSMLRNYYQGADTILYLACEDLDHGNGEFWFDRKIAPKSYFKNGPATPPQEREQLWNLLLNLKSELF